MAEKEKRRATTFRTSRGAIVNVNYPDIYIAPSIAPVDVTSPAEMREVLREFSPHGRESGVIWQYGGGMVGSKQDLLVNHPRYAEETPDETVLISDNRNNVVIEVDKGSMAILWSYSKGLNYPNCAHRLANGNTMIGDGLNARVIEVNPAGNIVWTYTIAGCYEVADAVLLDDGTMLITYWEGYGTTRGHVLKINYATQATIYNAFVGAPSSPRWIHVIRKTGANLSFAGGDYLIGDSFYRIFEFNDATQTIVWQYGTLNVPRHAYNYLAWTDSAIIGWTDAQSPLMFIIDGEYGRIFAINRDKEIVWQYGWSYDRLRPSILLNTPNSIQITKRGTLLIADSGGSKVVEIMLRDYEIPREWADLFSAEVHVPNGNIRDTLARNSYVAEIGWHPWGRATIFINNGLNQDVSITLQGSVDAAFTNPINLGDAQSNPFTVATATSHYETLSDLIPFIRLIAQCTVAPTSGSLTARVEVSK